MAPNDMAGVLKIDGFWMETRIFFLFSHAAVLIGGYAYLWDDGI